jgi:HK97 family phage portal protein
VARRTLLPALRGALTGKDLAAAGPVEQKVITVGSWSPSTSGRSWGTEGRADGWDMATVIQEGFERVIWVFRCVQKQSWDQASLPFRFGRDIGGDDEEVLEDHPLYRVLNRRANPLETGKQFRKRLSAQVLLSKRGAFVEVTRSRLGTITRLDLLAPDRCRPVPDPRGDYLSHFEFVRSDGEVREIDPEKIRWIRDPHPTDPFSGVTPLEAAGISVELDFLMRLYNVTFIKNDARAGGIVAIDADGMSDQQLAKVQSRLQPGPQNAGHTALVGTGPGGLNYVDLSAKPRDMNYADATKNAKEEILAAFGIGESLLGNAAGPHVRQRRAGAVQLLVGDAADPPRPHRVRVRGRRRRRRLGAVLRHVQHLLPGPAQEAAPPRPGGSRQGAPLHRRVPSARRARPRRQRADPRPVGVPGEGADPHPAGGRGSARRRPGRRRRPDARRYRAAWW